MNKQEDTSQNSKNESIISNKTDLYWLVPVSIGLLHLGGWYIAWGKYIYGVKTSIYLKNGLAIKFNNGYYGMLFDSRYFDSPAISYVLGFLGICGIIEVIKYLFGE